LATEVIRETGLLYCELDFLLSATAAAVEARILDKVGQMLQQMLPRTKSLKGKILQIFHQLKPEITISALGQKIVLHAPNQRQQTNTICEVLLNLDKAAQALNKKIVMLMDEFQQISQLKDKHVIEASIRHAVERSQNVTYLFSGSNRHLLSQMFIDKNRPFYRLCATMHLKRIQKEEYIQFIQKHAKNKWKKHLSEEAMTTIIRLSECHPYYVNLICRYFWDNNQIPEKNKIEQMWNEYIASQEAVLAHDILSLSNNQKILLTKIACHPTNQPFSQAYLLSTQLNIASQKEATKKLMLKDFIYKDDAGYLRVLDPAMQYFINQRL
jgi:hypothetical protein